MAKMGFFEYAVFTKDGIKVGGWALDTKAGEPPHLFRYKHGNTEHEFAPNLQRLDVIEGFGGEPLCGFSYEFAPDLDDSHASSDPSVTAIWSDGSALSLKNLSTGRYETKHLQFSNLDEFSAGFQNPSFRTKNRQIVAWAARRAIALSAPGDELFMAGATVLTYRHICDGIGAAEEIADVIAKWDSRAFTPEPPSGLRLRWVGSTHLAFAYAYLLWGRHDEALKEFEAICDLTPMLETWPQAATNLAIAHFMAGWLLWRSGDTQHAISLLERSPKILEAAGTVNIWSWHHFEEFRGFLAALQECFALLTILKGDDRAHVLPLSHVLTFSRISRIAEDLARKGALSDSMLPPRGWKQSPH